MNRSLGMHRGRWTRSALAGCLVLVSMQARSDPPIYVPLPPAATPFADPETPVALLHPPAQAATTEYQIGFDTRQVDIQSYLKVDSALGLDSMNLWENHYGELSDYLADMLAASRRKAIDRELSGQARQADSAADAANRYELPVKIPEWAKRLGLSKPALSLTGSYTLQLKAASHWTSAQEAAGTANKIPDFSPEQIPNINLTGQIGQFVSMSLTWNQSGFGATQNQDLHIKYAGQKPEDTEDDILQEAEFGQIQLALPGTSLTGYSEAASGVLGLRAKMRFGDVDLTLVGGSQNGEQQKQHIGRGATVSVQPLIRDRDMDVGYDFFLTAQARKNWGTAGGALAPQNTPTLNQPATYNVYQRVKPTDVTTHPNWSVSVGTATSYDTNGLPYYTTPSGQSWRLLSPGTDYYWQNGVLRMTRSGAASTGQALGVVWLSYQSGGPNGTNRGSGGSGTKTVTLSLLYADDHDDPYLQKLQLRNRYYKLPTVATGDQPNMTLKVLDNTSTRGDPSVDSTGTSWAYRLGLADGNGRLFYDNSAIFDWANHALIFPTLEPFRPYGQGEDYDTIRTALPTLPSRFSIQITAKSTSDSIQIGSRDVASVSGTNCVDIIQGSEVLTLNGSTRLTKGVDYDVQYQTGTITLLSSRARDPSADIQVDYTCTPFFSLANRTVAGARLDYQLPEISKESEIGATFLYRSETTTDPRPQLAREGSTAMLWGANLLLAGESESLTDWTGMIPLIKAKADSKWRLEMEGVQSWVDPNPSGYALVDDFESSQLDNELPINRLGWYQASPPGAVVGDSTYDDTLNYQHQGELVWSSNAQVQLSYIYPTHDDGTGAPAMQNVLHLRFEPNERSGAGMSWGGIMRTMPPSSRNLTSDAYLVVVVQGTGGDLNFDFGDVSEDLSIDGYEPDGILESEDLDTARNPTGRKQNDLGLDGKADTGETAKVWTCYRLDCQSTLRTHNGVLDPAGDDFRPDAISSDPDASINGTQGNDDYVDGGSNTFFDSENLFGDGTLHTLNAYNRFRIVMGGADSTPYQALAHGYRLYQIPLNKPFQQRGGGASWNQINYVRVWVDGLTTAKGANILREDYQIARMALLGNQWLGTGHLSKNDDTTVVDSTYSQQYSSVTKTVSQDSSSLQVSVIGTTTDNSNYVPSAAVPQVRDPNTGALQPEQSLRLIYTDLHRDFGAAGALKADTGVALRTYDVPRDFTLYQDLELLVYHQSVDGRTDAGPAPVRFGVELGSGDPTSASAPYYEYSFDPVPATCPIGDQTAGCQDQTTQARTAAMQANWNDNQILIPLKTLTDLKTLRRQKNLNVDSFFSEAISSPIGRLDAQDSVKVFGDPTVSQVSWMRFWVRANPRTAASAVSDVASGEIWIDDLRLNTPHRAFGSALRAAGQVNFSDLLDLSASTQYSGGNFVPMGQTEPTFAQQKSSATVTGTARLSMDKFLPESWKAQLPVSVTFNGALTRPWAVPGSDQQLSEDGIQRITSDWWDGRMRRDSSDFAQGESRAYETMVVTRTISSSWTRARDENSGLGPFLTNTLFARPKLAWTYTDQASLAPNNRDSTWNHTVRLDYDFSPPPPPNLKPFGAAKAAWVPDFLKTFDFQPWPTAISSTLADLDYLEGLHSVLTPDKDSLPLTHTHTYTANLNHAVSLEWPVLNFVKLSFSERAARVWNDSIQAPLFDPSTGLVNAWPYIFDWDTTHLRSPSGVEERQQFGLLRNENGRTTTFSFDLTPRILPWFTTTGGFQASGALNRQAPTASLDAANDTLYTQFWTYSHSDNFRSSLRLDVPAVFRSLQGVLPDSWSKPLNDAKQGIDRWRWTGIGVEYSVDDRESGIDQTLDYASYHEQMDASSMQLWQMGLGDNRGLRSPLDLITGSRPKSGFGQYAPLRLTDPNYLPGVNDTASEALFTGQDNTRSYRVSTNTDFTVPGLLLTLQPSLTYMISWDERWSTPWDVDTTKTWPQISVNASLANFAGRVPFLGRWFESVTANHTTTWEVQQQIYPHSSSNDVTNYSLKWAPLLGLQAKTKGNWSFDDKTNFGVTLAKSFIKNPDSAAVTGICPDSLGLPVFYTNQAVAVERCFQVVGHSQTYHWNTGNEGTATYRFQTHKGIQIFRWFVKLDNDLVVTFRAGWTRDWQLQNTYDASTGQDDGPQTLADVTTVYAGSNASYNFTSKLAANFDASYKRTDQKDPTDPSAPTVANDISLLASLQYKF